MEVAEERAEIEAAKSGDSTAFGRLLRAHDNRMRGYAFRLLGDREAMDDVLQDAYVKAYRSLPTYQLGESRFSSWLYRVVHSCAMDHHRRLARRPQVALAHVVDVIPNEEDPAVNVVERDALRAALLQLPADQAEAVALISGEGMSYAEAAELIGVTTGTLGSRLSRAHAALRHHLSTATEGGIR